MYLVHTGLLSHFVVFELHGLYILLCGMWSLDAFSLCFVAFPHLTSGLKHVNINILFGYFNLAYMSLKISYQYGIHTNFGFLAKFHGNHTPV